MNGAESNNRVDLTLEDLDQGQFLKIANVDSMRPFFMTIVSDSDLWMFISSNGGLTAGRKNSEFALFPYYTDDKITEFADITGSKSIFKIKSNSEFILWEPFSNRNPSNLNFKRNLYKSIYGNQIIFEEVLTDLGISFRYKWSSSNRLGFVKSSYLSNQSKQEYTIEMLDGLQNIMPCGVHSDLQSASSNLVDAYKRSELHQSSGVGIFALSAIIVDKAEPSEALKTNIVWSTGIDGVEYLLSSLQLDNYRKRKSLVPERDIKGEKGGYFIYKTLKLAASQSQSWQILADVNKSQSQVIDIIHLINKYKDLSNLIAEEINQSTKNLLNLVSAADGYQQTEDNLQDFRHYSNVLFNIMRGGIFDHNCTIEKQDFISYLTNANIGLFKKYSSFFDSLSSTFTYESLLQQTNTIQDFDLIRLSTEYLPLKFSRRHGDPSRPWNRFSINIQDESGQKILDYQGNWRDIFQNWEALAYSYPTFLDGMLFKFLNASTFDGYNPYRVTKDGFDWETIEPDDPWSYIGYWGDHQIIYLLKFLEAFEKFYPGKLNSYFNQDYFVYAAVPYKIKPYIDIVKNAKVTIDFDHHWDADIRKNRLHNGSDGALLSDHTGEIYHVNLIEKLLATILSKLSNFIPGGGIWMNTQRPEWNDANNALVGNGVSMVTLYYLRRFLVFFQGILKISDLEQIKISGELIEFYHTLRQIFEESLPLLESEVSDLYRNEILDKLGTAASDYRELIYKSGFWGKKRSASISGMIRFVSTTLQFIEHSIRSNQRKDNLYHAYNLMTYSVDGIKITQLDEMLEGQVAVLSSGYLNATQALRLLDAMKASSLFRPDQYSYILYPNKQLPGFLQKNIIPKAWVETSALAMKLLDSQNHDIIDQDANGQYHFNSSFKNASYLQAALEGLKLSGLHEINDGEIQKLLDIFESVFNHKAFTGRSGTFYGYEGLGSIYWHMVSKLLLAIQEICLKAIENQASPIEVGRLLDHYYEVQAGIGVHKSPKLYGAFPTDPYSHTPMHRGAQQPGMTGQVKEDILVRWGELGIEVVGGQLRFNPSLLRRSEFLTNETELQFTDVNSLSYELALNKDQLFFTYCQVAVIYEISDNGTIEVTEANGQTRSVIGNTLAKADSDSIFNRSGAIISIRVFIKENSLK